MARTGFFHHIGTFLLFAAAILLLITTISAPVVNNIGITKVSLKNGSTVAFGTFGYCIDNVDTDANDSHDDWCTGKHVGYSIMKIMANIDGVSYSSASTNTADGLTRVMILHPISCGLAFIAFLLALGSGVFGALLASLFAFLAWALTLVIMAIDFTLFGIVKNHVNDDDTGSHAFFSVGMWTILAAMVSLFFGMFVVLFTCFSARRHRNDGAVRHGHKSVESGYVGNGTTATTRTKRRFWQRRSAY